jgi:DNA-binding NarL/FixJ family response regulator
VLGDLRAARAGMAIIAMGVVDNEALRHAAVRHGAVDRVLKDAPAAELARAIRNAAARGPHLCVVPPEA